MIDSFASLEAVQAVFDALPVPVFLKDRQHRYVLANRAFADMIGQAPADLMGRPDSDFGPADEIAIFHAVDDQVFATGVLNENEEVVTDHAGRSYVALTRKQLVHIPTVDGGSEAFLAAVVSDVTPFREAEARARRAETLQAAESRIFGAMADGAPLSDVLHTVTTVIDEVSSGATASVLLLDAGSGRLMHGAAPGLPAAYNEGVNGVLVGPNAGSCGAAAHFRKQVIVSDIETDPRWDDFRHLAREHGLRACWSTPIEDGAGELLGAFALYYREPRSPQGEDLALIARATQLVAIAIERAARNEKLRASEERFQQLASTVDDVFWMTSPDGHEMIYMSPAYEKVWGRPVADLYENPLLWIEAIVEEDRAAVEAAFARHSEGFQAEYRIRRPDGEVRWISDRGFPVRNAAGEVFRVTGVAHDVTKIKKAELALRARTEHAKAEATRRQAIFDSARDAIITLDPHGCIESINVTGERMFGYAANELLGKDLSTVVTLSPPSDGDLAQRLRSGRVLGDGDVYELEARCKDETILQVDVNLGEMAQPDGVHFVAVLRDSTERKRIEKTKEEFISTVSHELRTPLTSIAGALGLLTAGAAGDLPERANRLVTIAESNSRRLVRLINDILDIEKMQSGQMTFTFRSVELCELSRNATDGMNGLASELGVTFEHQGSCDRVLVQADADRLTQVLANLLSNAAKFSPSGGRIKVTVGASGSRAQISVQDEGPGIPEEFQDRIFSKFAQADASDTRQKGGTGLGLAISKEIVERHGGRIWFDSPPGQGATFHVELPLAATESQTVEGGRRLLLCEDDADVSEVLTRVLAMQGFNVQVAASLAEAEAALCDPSAFEGMLLDLRLPDGNGLDLLRKIRSQPETCALPVIVISADSRGSGASTLDIIDWIEKPVDFKRLQRCLEQFLKVENEPPLVLHVDDDPDLRQLVCEAFGGRGRLIAADSVQAARQLLATVTPDIAILDIGLPDGSGLDLLPNLVDANGRALPVVIFSAQNLEQTTLTDAVDAVLTKSRTSLDQLIRTVSRLSANGEVIKVHNEFA
jgi:PAS domain S-box-containing protein